MLEQMRVNARVEGAPGAPGGNAAVEEGVAGAVGGEEVLQAATL